MSNYSELLKSDFRVQEGITACINCGVCTSICPAAAFNNYDPRIIAETVQRGIESEIVELLKGDTIWFCGECLSCKTRCPRGNTPAYLIQALRALSIESGLFAESEQGRKQLALKNMIGEHILKYGYCVYIDEVNTEKFPEQGPIWDWYHKNRVEVLKRLGASYGEEKPGTLRKISQKSLDDLKKIFDETGGTERFEKIEHFSQAKQEELGMNREEYLHYLYTGNIANRE